MVLTAGINRSVAVDKVFRLVAAIATVVRVVESVGVFVLELAADFGAVDAEPDCWTVDRPTATRMMV